MEQPEIESIVGRLYLLIMDRERQIQELRAEVAKLKQPPLSPREWTAMRNEDESA